LCKHLKYIHFVPADSQRYKDRLNPTVLRALETQYGLSDYIKNSQVFTDESIQREVKNLQLLDTLAVPSHQNKYNDRKKSILNLMSAMNVYDKHRKELRTILNNTSQSHLAEYLSDYEGTLFN